MDKFITGIVTEFESILIGPTQSGLALGGASALIQNAFMDIKRGMSEITKIHNDFAEVGKYKATWNGMDNNGIKAPSGVYFYELKAENHFHKVKKMTLLK